MRVLLSQGLSELGLDMSRAEALERFSSLLLEKNQMMNLTAITEPTPSRSSTCSTARRCCHLSI